MMYLAEMRRFRYYNLILIVGFLCGIGLTSHHAGQHIQRSGTDYITNWLLTFADQSNSELASEKLKDVLSSESDNFESILARASVVMAENPDLFNIPNNKDGSSNEDVFKVLITQWNQQQETGGMAKAVQVDRSRATTTAPYENISLRHGYRSTLNILDTATDFLVEALPGAADFLGRILRPLVDGISINAP